MGVMGVQNENNILDQNSSLNYQFYGWILFIHVRSIHLEHLKKKKNYWESNSSPLDESLFLIPLG